MTSQHGVPLHSMATHRQEAYVVVALVMLPELWLAQSQAASSSQSSQSPVASSRGSSIVWGVFACHCQLDKAMLILEEKNRCMLPLPSTRDVEQLDTQGVLQQSAPLT